MAMSKFYSRFLMLINRFSGVFSVIAQEHAFVTRIDGNVMALEADNGNMIWRHRFNMSVCSEPCMEGDQVVFGSWYNYMIGFDTKTGHVNGCLKWGTRLRSQLRPFTKGKYM